MRSLQRSVRLALALVVGSIVVVSTNAPTASAAALLGAEQTRCLDGELPDGRQIPANATVTATVTGIQPDAIGFISLHAPEQPFDETSSVNVNPGLNLANTTSYTAGPDGGICITSSVTTDATIDVIGYDTTDAGSIVNERILDTRTSGRLAPGSAVCIDGTLPSGTTIPSGATVTATVTGIQPDAIGFISLHAPEQPFDETSSVNVNPGLNLANTTSYTAGPDGGICITSSVTTNATIDIVGYGTSNSTSVVAGERLYDSREEGFKIGPRFFPVSWKCVDPALPSGAEIPEDATVVATITGVQPEGIGFINFSQPSGPPDVTSAVNVAAGLNVANTTVFKAEDDICMHSSVLSHVTVDVVSYDPAGAMTFINQRLFDTRRAPLATPVNGPAAPVFVEGDSSLVGRVSVSCQQGFVRRQNGDTDPITTLKIEVSGLPEPQPDDRIGGNVRLYAPAASVRSEGNWLRNTGRISVSGDGHSLVMRGAFSVRILLGPDRTVSEEASFEIPGVICETHS